METMTDRQDQDVLSNAEAIIQRFGGIRPMAHKMEVPVTTVQGWKKRNVIPANRRADVLQAARVNGVDVSDLVEKGGANENAFKTEMKEAEEQQDETVFLRHEDAVLKAQSVPVPSESLISQEALMSKIKSAQNQAVWKSTWISAGLVVFVVGCTAFLLWPNKQQVVQNGQKIVHLEEQVETVKGSHSLLKALVPDDIEKRFTAIKEQAEDVQARVGEMASHAEALTEGVLGPDAGPLSARIAVLEQEVAVLGGGSSTLNSLLERVRQMQQSIEGQETLSTSIADLNMLMGSLQGRMDQVDDVLQGAQLEDDALGQTLEGVSPTDLKAAAMLLGLAQFRHSLNRSAPFEDDLALMRKMMGEENPDLIASLEKLSPWAAEGILTPEGLSGEFKGLAGDIVVSSLKGEDVSVKEKALARMNDILQVEKDGELITGTDTQAKVARAQKMIDDGDIQGAIAELQSLDGDAAQTALPWIENAEVTLLAQQVQAMLTQQVMSRVGGGALSLKGGMSGLENIMGDFQNIVPGASGQKRRVIHNDASGISILPAKQKMKLPDISLDR